MTTVLNIEPIERYNVLNGLLFLKTNHIKLKLRKKLHDFNIFSSFYIPGGRLGLPLKNKGAANQRIVNVILS